jgi:hypothetical protein
MPDTDFCGYDRFVYTINTNTQVDSATVTVHILCDSPTFTPTGSVVGTPDFTEDGAVALISLACNTIMNDPVLKEVPSGDITFTSYGDHGDCSIKYDSMIMYIPDQGFSGYDEVSSRAIVYSNKAVSFIYFLIFFVYHHHAQCTFSICDSAGTCFPVILKITIIPDAIAIEETTSMGAPISIEFADLYDLSHTAVDITYDPTNGELTAGAEGTLLYTPNADFTGSDVLEYSACTVATPVRCDESTITIFVIATEVSPMTEQSIIASTSNIITEGTAETVVSKESSEIDYETKRAPIMVGAFAVFGVLLALSGAAAYNRNRRTSTNGNIRSLAKNGSYDTEVTALTGNNYDKMRPLASTLDIPYGVSNSNLSITAFLTGETDHPQDPESSKSRKSSRSEFFRDDKSVLFPLSPANSLFSPTHSVCSTTSSVASHRSKKSNFVEDVVDL